MTDPALSAARAIFEALFDGAHASGLPWDEGRWEDFMRVVSEAGRFVFGYPHHEAPDASQMHISHPDPTIDPWGFTPNQRRLVDALRAQARPDQDSRILTPESGDEGEAGNSSENDPPPEIPRPDRPAVDKALMERVRPFLEARERAIDGARPEPVRVECDGCGMSFQKGPGIAAHRRRCAALEKVERAGAPQGPPEEVDREAVAAEFAERRRRLAAEKVERDRAARAR